MALNVDKVFRFVQFVSNKESRGWVSPAEFNIAAEVAQIVAYSKRETVFLQTKKILDDLRPFMKMSSAISPASGLCAYPADMRHFIVGYMDSDLTEIVEITQAELPNIMKSTIVAPSATYPFGVQRDDGFQIYPTSITADIRMEYLTSPTAPAWGYTTASGRPVYASGSSTDFGFDDILFFEIVTNILMHIGININSELVAQYGTAFNAQQ